MRMGVSRFVDRAGVIGASLRGRREQDAVVAERDALLLEVRRLREELEAVRIDRAAFEADQRRMHRRLVHTSKMSAVGELSAAVAHGVNNPLTGVLGYAELLLADRAEGDPGREELEIIRNEALRARAIVRALVDFARPRSPERVSVELPEVLTGALDLIRYHVERGGIRIVETYDPVEPLDVDPGSIQQVMLNLCQNAVQAMPEGGELRIALHDSEGATAAIVSVEDTGHGMDPATAERAFEPFFTTRDNVEANGLGLSVSRSLVEAHGGTITLRPVATGGTRAVVRLPRHAGDDTLDVLGAGPMLPVAPPTDAR